MSGSNEIIHGAGEVTITPGKHCTWYTTNGSTCTIVITNADDANTLTFLVSGAPDTINGEQAKETHPFNSRWSIPPKQPTQHVTAFGDFRGQVISIMNISEPAASCHIRALVS